LIRLLCGSAIITAKSQCVTLGYVTAAALLCLNCYDRCYVVLYWFSCLITCIAHSATNPSIKPARYWRRWMLHTSDILSASAKAVRKWQLRSLIAKFCAVLMNSHVVKRHNVDVCAK
jgi:hypothetical protein